MDKPDAPIFDKINTSKNLPSLPHILLRLVEVCNRDDSSINDISRIIDKDTSLCAKVLRMINSTYYGLSKRITSIEQALTLLGIDTIRNIAISASVNQAFGKIEGSGVFNMKVFWRHSLSCGILAKLIAKKVAYPAAEEAFLTGVLHDAGKLVLWANFTKTYTEILESSNGQWDLMLAEERRHGATHSEVGSWLIKKWKLQSFMSDAILYHHEAVDRIHSALPLVKIVYCANLLCPETDKEDEVKYGIVKNIFGFEAAEIRELMEDSEEDIKAIAQSFDIDLTTAGTPSGLGAIQDGGKQEDLIREVKDYASLQGTLRNLLETHDEESILKTSRRGFEILFDVQDVLVFLHDADKDVLLGRTVGASTYTELAEEMIIPFWEGYSIISSALLQESLMDSFDESEPDGLTIVDEQIIRIMGKEGILCLPLTVQKQPVGVIVFGVDGTDVVEMREKTNLLAMLARQIATALYAVELRRRKSRLVLSERLSASSDVTRRVVHEVNTPLSIVTNYLEVLGRKLGSDNQVQNELKIISEEIDRVGKIVNQLSDLSDPGVGGEEAVDINSVLSDILGIFRESKFGGNDIEVHLEVDSALPSISADRDKLKQVFINLIQNAVDALAQGGNIYVRTRYGDQQNGNALISVRDDGPGIPDDIRPRIFEPYITTKKGGHSGLGLPIVYNIIRELKGTIQCESNDGDGTSFEISLPLVPTP